MHTELKFYSMLYSLLRQPMCTKWSRCEFMFNAQCESIGAATPSRCSWTRYGRGNSIAKFKFCKIKFFVLKLYNRIWNLRYKSSEICKLKTRWAWTVRIYYYTTHLMSVGMWQRWLSHAIYTYIDAILIKCHCWYGWHRHTNLFINSHSFHANSSEFERTFPMIHGLVKKPKK